MVSVKQNMKIEERMKELGLPLHELPKLPENFRRVFRARARVRVSGNRAWVSGHGPTTSNGTIYPKLG